MKTPSNGDGGPREGAAAVSPPRPDCIGQGVKRIQRKRTKGWRKPAGCVIVTRPSKWGNPHKCENPKDPAQRAEAVRLFEEDLIAGRLRVTVADAVRELRGKDIACACNPLDGMACHGDVWIRVANGSEGAL